MENKNTFYPLMKHTIVLPNKVETLTLNVEDNIKSEAEDNA